MQTLEYYDWILRTNLKEQQEYDQIFLLLHGWTGDENSMSIFEKTLPADALILSPRAPYNSSANGFSWANDEELTAWPGYHDLLSSARTLKELLDLVKMNTVIDFEGINLVGFSQGAALSIVFSLIYPELVQSIAFLSGFFPKTPEASLDHQLNGIKVYAAHGSRDKIVPLERAEAAIERLRGLGAEVNFCITDVGHKLGLDCYQALNEFFSPEHKK